MSTLTVETTMRSLSCKLTPDELQAVGRKMAREIQLANEAENAKKSSQAQYKATIEAHQANINLASEKINTGVEYREIECDIVFDYDANIRYLRRRDTYETVESRPLAKEEKQRSLSFAGELDASVEAGKRNGAAPEIVHEENGFLFSNPIPDDNGPSDDEIAQRLASIGAEEPAAAPSTGISSQGLSQATKAPPKHRLPRKTGRVH